MNHLNIQNNKMSTIILPISSATVWMILAHLDKIKAHLISLEPN